MSFGTVVGDDIRDREYQDISDCHKFDSFAQYPDIVCGRALWNVFRSDVRG